MGLLLPLSVAAALLLCSSAALGNPSRVDTGIVADRTLMDYTANWVYKGNDARDLRSQVGGADGVNASESEMYLEGLRAASNGSVAPLLAWDATSPTWWNLAVSASNLENTSGTVVVTYQGKLLLNSSEGTHHTFTVQKPSSVSAFEVNIQVPPTWRIDGATGLSITGQSNGTLIGSVSGSLATIEISEAPSGGGDPPINDTTNPVVNAGQDASVSLGETASFSGVGADNDPNLTFWWTFTYNGTELNFTGQNMSFTFWALGDYILTFTAMDSAGNRGSDTLTLQVVSPDQEAPTVLAGDDRTVYAGDQVWFVGDAFDNDPLFPMGARFLWTLTYNGSQVSYPTSSFSMIFWLVGNYTVTYQVTDFWGNTGTDTVVVEVLKPDTTPPTVEVEAVPTIEATVPFTLHANATDNDPAFPEGASFWWTFMDQDGARNITGTVLNYTFQNVGTYWVTFTAVDFWGNRADETFAFVVVPPDREAPVVTAYGNLTAQTGDPVRLIGTATDNFPGLMENGTFLWTFSKDGVDLNVSVTGLEETYTFSEPGHYVALFQVWDAWGNTANSSFVIAVSERVPDPPDPTPPGDTTPSTNPLSVDAILRGDPLAMLMLLGLGAAGAVGILAVRRRSARAALEALPAPAAPAKPAHVVEAVLILNRDGRLIHFQSSGAEAAYESPEVIGSMFTAVTEFIRDSFGKDEALSRLTYGQNTIVLDRSRHLFGALIVYGEPDKQLAEALTDTLRRLEIAYAGLVEQWNGDREAFEGIDGFVAPLIALTTGLTRADVRAAASDKTVRLGSGTEHFKGYIRLRVAMVNQTDQPIMDAKVTVLFNQGVLRLARVEPAGLKQEGFTVHLGDIGPGERLGASYYLDPQTCSQTNIEGVGTYKDAAGDSHTVKMKTRVAEIVCPLFFTPQHANPAMMRRLIETALDARDSRVYRVTKLGEGTNCNDLFNMAREAVQRHHVVLVRNIKQKEPFEGNAWFYGQTKHSRSPVVIRVTVSQKRRTVEFFVAVDSPATLTGMLAEFQRSFTEMMAARAPGVAIEQVMDDSLKAILSMEGLERRPRENLDPPPTGGATANGKPDGNGDANGNGKRKGIGNPGAP